MRWEIDGNVSTSSASMISYVAGDDLYQTIQIARVIWEYRLPFGGFSNNSNCSITKLTFFENCSLVLSEATKLSNSKFIFDGIFTSHTWTTVGIQGYGMSPYMTDVKWYCFTDADVFLDPLVSIVWYFFGKFLNYDADFFKRRPESKLIQLCKKHTLERCHICMKIHKADQLRQCNANVTSIRIT